MKRQSIVVQEFKNNSRYIVRVANGYSRSPKSVSAGEFVNMRTRIHRVWSIDFEQCLEESEVPFSVGRMKSHLDQRFLFWELTRPGTK